MAPPKRPKIRADLEVVEIDGEGLVYDEPADLVHYLNPTAAILFQLCDGKATVERERRRHGGSVRDPARGGREARGDPRGWLSTAPACSRAAGPALMQRRSTSTTEAGSGSTSSPGGELRNSTA